MLRASRAKLDARLDAECARLEQLRETLVQSHEDRLRRLRELASTSEPSWAFVIDRGRLVIFDTETMEIMFDAVPKSMYTLGVFARSRCGKLHASDGSTVFFVDGIVGFKSP